ncbi:hypothetical protein [Solemya velum gill symbiont]|uniref:hypothetical protein n=1 Tax=Solemya velum gill symbiont TaxID=2340 RepID=UPI00117B67BC|nr:hypothetical protein [Solemya velum gill symbiont]
MRQLKFLQFISYPTQHIIFEDILYLEAPTILYTLHNIFKSITYPLAFQSLFAGIRHTYRDHHPIYIDSSKDKAKVSAAMYAPHFVDTARLLDDSSIFSAELYASIIA